MRLPIRRDKMSKLPRHIRPCFLERLPISQTEREIADAFHELGNAAAYLVEGFVIVTGEQHALPRSNAVRQYVHHHLGFPSAWRPRNHRQWGR